MEELRPLVWIQTCLFVLLVVVLRREKATPLLLGISTAVIAAWSATCGLMAYLSWREAGQVSVQWAIFFLVSALVVKMSFGRFQRLQKAMQN